MPTKAELTEAISDAVLALDQLAVVKTQLQTAISNLSALAQPLQRAGQALRLIQDGIAIRDAQG